MAYSKKKKINKKTTQWAFIVNKIKQENSPPAQMRHSALRLHFELSTALCLQSHVFPWKHGCAAPGTEGSRGGLCHSSTSTHFGSWQTPAEHWKRKSSRMVKEVSLDNKKLQEISPYPSSSQASMSQAPGSAGLQASNCTSLTALVWNDSMK